MHVLRPIAAALALLLTQCAREDLAARIPASRVSTNLSDAAAAASLISRYRAAHGLGGVSVDARLNQAAQVQARAVAQAGSLSHGEFASRMASFGVRGVSAENLVAGSSTVDEAIARWKSSPAHNRNLLLAEARRIGLARADSPGEGYGRYWALVLAQ